MNGSLGLIVSLLLLLLMFLWGHLAGEKQWPRRWCYRTIAVTKSCHQSLLLCSSQAPASRAATRLCRRRTVYDECSNSLEYVSRMLNVSYSSNADYHCYYKQQLCFFCKKEKGKKRAISLWLSLSFSWHHWPWCWLLFYRFIVVVMHIQVMTQIHRVRWLLWHYGICQICFLFFSLSCKAVYVCVSINQANGGHFGGH